MQVEYCYPGSNRKSFKFQIWQSLFSEKICEVKDSDSIREIVDASGHYTLEYLRKKTTRKIKTRSCTLTTLTGSTQIVDEGQFSNLATTRYSNPRTM